MDTIYAVAIHRILDYHLSKYYSQLLDCFGSWKAVWESNVKPECLEIPKNIWERLIASKNNIDPQKVGEELLEKGIKYVTRDSRKYPDSLLGIANSPGIIYYIGDIKLLKGNCLSIIGARKATYYGLKQAKQFAYELAASGLVIVSGMARGIDGIAHEGALEAQGKTIAVLGSGLDIPYPPENQVLYEKIKNKGLAISEFIPGTPPLKRNFPMRNRIISGLSKGVFLVEARAQSGSLITCDYALEQGKEVFALPGPVSSPASIGTLRIIQQGAKLVIFPEDILEELGWEIKNNRYKQLQTSKTELSQEEKIILAGLAWEPLHIDYLLEKYESYRTAIYGLLLELELKGLIKQLPGKYYVRV